MELELPSDDSLDLPSEVEALPAKQPPPKKARTRSKKGMRHPKSLAECCRDYVGTFGPQKR